MCFCGHKNFCLPCSGGIDATFMKNNNELKNKFLKLRVSSDELDKLKSLSKDYPSLSSYILDACWHFNSKRHIKKLEYIEQKYDLIVKLRSDINHLSANLNQLVIYTNNCIKMGVYLNNTSNEVIRIQSELLECLSKYKSEIRKLENDLKKAVRLL